MSVLGALFRTKPPHDTADKPGPGYFRQLLAFGTEVKERLETALATHLAEVLTANGDLLTRIAGEVTRLQIGSTPNHVLSVVGGLPAWQAPQASALSGAVAIANGGTGQTSKTPAFDALAPTTTTGDLIYYNGTDNVRLAVGGSTQHLAVSGGAPAWVEDVQWVRKTANSTSTSTSLADVDGLSFSIAAGSYTFEFLIIYLSSTSTNGIQLAINGPTLDGIVYSSEIMASATAGTDQYHTAVINAYDTAHSPGNSGGATVLLARLHGALTVTASGTFVVRYASEAAGPSSVTIGAGSSGWIRKL